MGSRSRWDEFKALGISVRAAATAMGMSHSTLHEFLRKDHVPKRRPTLKDDYTRWLATQAPAQPQEERMLTKLTLPDEVLKHFGLARDPFSAEIDSIDDIYESRAFVRAERTILSAADHAGWVVVTGAVGSGKSTLLKKCEARLHARKDMAIVKPRTLEKQYLGASHICDAILHDLSDMSLLTSRTLEYKARLVGRLLEECYRDGRKVALLIDEAHMLTTHALLGLKRLYEFETGFKKLLAIILVGQPALAKMLRTNFALAEVSQRVDLFELDESQLSVGPYLTHKLQRAGANGTAASLFAPAALKVLAERAETPLALNNLAAFCLYSAYDIGEKVISADLVREVQGG